MHPAFVSYHIARAFFSLHGVFPYRDASHILALVLAVCFGSCQVCGQNPAYDFFPSQHQIFYRGRAKNEMWYDPVFKVVTINGEKVNRYAALQHWLVVIGWL